MKRIVLTIIGVLLLAHSGLVFGFNGPSYRIGIDDVEEMLSLKSSLAANDVALTKINKVLSHLEKRHNKYKTEEEFVEYLYYYAHQKLLKRYTKYPSIEETLTEGDYDCLTATTVYSILLSELSVKHAVIETNYHIYILVNPDTRNELLIETTDPRNGFVQDQHEISELKKRHLENNLTERSSLISFEFNIERRLEQKELIGLLYYNQSIRELNKGELFKAKEMALNASMYYSQTRVESLMNLIDSASF